MQLRHRLVAGVLLCAVINSSILMILHWISTTGAHQANQLLLDEQDPDRKIQALGIAHSNALTINWLGFEKPTWHQAPKADIEQSFFAREPAPQTPPSPQPSSQPTPASPTNSSTAQAAPVDLRALLAQLRQSVDGVRTSLSAQLQQLALQMPPSPAQQSPASTPLPPGATPSEKESTPTALREPILVRPGQVLSAQGLEIITVKPEFTYSTKLLTKPNNMVVRIRFGREGEVIEAIMLTTSGVTTVDEPVMNAVYRWRASGVALKKIPATPPGSGIEVDFRIDVR
jgi:pyruvate/2-oxoglutarate dehydrogenase complex dihydrolipoamide acyltransferase (E2) component